MPRIARFVRRDMPTVYHVISRTAHRRRYQESGGRRQIEEGIRSQKDGSAVSQGINRLSKGL